MARKKEAEETLGRDNLSKQVKEPSVSGYDWRMQRTIATAFYAFVIGRVSPRPSIPGMVGMAAVARRKVPAISSLHSDRYASLGPQAPFVCHEKVRNVISSR